MLAAHWFSLRSRKFTRLSLTRVAYGSWAAWYACLGRAFPPFSVRLSLTRVACGTLAAWYACLGLALPSARSQPHATLAWPLVVWLRAELGPVISLARFPGIAIRRVGERSVGGAKIHPFSALNCALRCLARALPQPVVIGPPVIDRHRELMTKNE